MGWRARPALKLGERPAAVELVGSLHMTAVRELSSPFTVVWEGTAARQHVGSWSEDPNGSRSQMDEFAIRVPEMTCRHIARQVSALISDIDGVRTVRADLEGRSVRVRGDATPAEVVAVVAAAGHDVRFERTARSQETEG